MQFAGVSSGPNGFKTRARRSPARSFDNARKRIDSLARRFDQVIIEHQDYEEILANYDDSRATVVFYLDPPYMDSSHHNGKEFDHQKFFEALHDVDNDWVLSLSQLPNELSDYWCTSRKSRHKMKQERGSVEEMLICNFDPRSRELFSETL